MSSEKRSHPKLIDYTKHRRDDITQSTYSERSLGGLDYEDSEQLLGSRSLSSVNSSLSMASYSDFMTTMGKIGNPDSSNNSPIDFLMKVPLSARRRYSDLSRRELLVECAKKLIQDDSYHHTGPPENSIRMAERRGPRSSTSQRSSLISAILRHESEEKIIERKRSEAPTRMARSA